MSEELEKADKMVNKASENAKKAMEKIQLMTSKLRQTRKAVRSGLLAGGFGSRITERLNDISEISGKIREQTSGGEGLLSRVRSQTENPNPTSNVAKRPRFLTGGILQSFLGPSEEELRAQEEVKREAEEQRKREEEEARLKKEEEVRQRKILGSKGEAPHADIYVKID